MTVEVSFLFTAVLFVLTVAGFLITRKQDTIRSIKEDDARLDSMKESLLKCNMKLDQICATTTETRTDIKAMDIRLSEMDKRVTLVERDLKTAFIKIDELNEK